MVGGESEQKIAAALHSIIRPGSTILHPPSPDAPILRPPHMPSASSFAHDLNPAQQDAVETLSGPLLVLAGAGTGKTRVVTFRISNLIRHRTPPERILAVTFTNKAANEMQSRVAALWKKRGKARPEISTFHALCARVLRRHIERLGYPRKFAIYDRGDQESVARSVLREIRVPGETLRPGDLLGIIGRWKSSGVRPDQAAADARFDKEHLAAMAYRRYQVALKAAGAVDFDDMLLLTEDLFTGNADIRREEAGRFDHLLIDEYQDTNASQYRIVRSLAAGHRNLCVVGDDDQSIYGWRGADVRHILRFKQDWPEAKVVRLEDNYRSTEAILTVANRVIAYNADRHAKVLRAARPGGEQSQILTYQNETLEAQETVASIQRLLQEPSIEPRHVAVLFRTNEQPRAFEAELRQAKLPYVLIGGMSFYDRKEVRDLLAYMKLLVSTADEVALLRIINTPPRGIGKTTTTTLMEKAVNDGVAMWDVLVNAHHLRDAVPSAEPAIARFTTLIQEYQRRLRKDPLVDVIRDLIQAVGYRGELERLYDNPSDQLARWDAVEELVNSLGNFQNNKSPSGEDGLRRFLEDVALTGRDQDSDKEKELDRNAIALMTLHAAKGLEFPFVFMVGMEEGLLPHHRSVKAEGAAIDEERRLCYVGITRAQDRLTFSLALTRMKWGKPRNTEPSRFLFEVTGQADKAHAGSPPAKPGRKSGRQRTAKSKSSGKKTSSPRGRRS